MSKFKHQPILLHDGRFMLVDKETIYIVNEYGDILEKNHYLGENAIFCEGNFNNTLTPDGRYLIPYENSFSLVNFSREKHSIENIKIKPITKCNQITIYKNEFIIVHVNKRVIFYY